MTELIAPAAESYAEAGTTAFKGQVASMAAWTRENTSAPQMMSGLAEARLLEALIVAGGARRVLEIGTFTAVGTLTMAAAVPADGRVTTLEVDTEMAAIARRHIQASPFADRVQLLVGRALETLATLDGPFDLVYIDAAKVEYPAYYDAVIPKLAERGVIVADNMFRAGSAMEANPGDEGTVAIKQFIRRVDADTRVHNVVLTVGDGVLLAWRRPANEP